MIQTPSASIDPIISRLRPRSIGEVIDHAFRLYRRHFLTFLAISAIIFVPVNLGIQALTIWIQGSAQMMDNTSDPITSSDIQSGAANEVFIGLIIALVALMVLAVLGGLLMYLSQGALTAAVADSHLDKPVSFGGAYRGMLKHVGPLLGIMVLQVLLVMAVFTPVFLLFVVALLMVGGSSDAAGAAFGLICLAFLAMIPAFVFYIYISVRWTLVIPAIMVENLGPVQAIRRSWGLVQDYWWRTAGLGLLLYIIEAVISAGPAYVVLALALVLFRNMDTVVISAITGGITVLTTLFYVPLELTAWTLYYFDQRVRKEGFDIETALAQRYPQAPPPVYYGGQPEQYGPPQGGAMAPPVLGYESQGAGYGQRYVQPEQPGRIAQDDDIPPKD
ncbi:MAG TPA: glycerophosphoryl diester phosphodiesterase membrane domain-containing protein [Chloroflexia bacterium]|nr:glycerophosphoryl diester phosphodiesterase membrane domain-containing protein [Chloroflexia bacterium]